MAAFCGKNDAWYDDGLSLLSREFFDCIQWFALLRIRNQFIELQLSCDWYGILRKCHNGVQHCV